MELTMYFDDPREIRLRALEMAIGRTYTDEEGRTQLFCAADVVIIADHFANFIADGSLIPETAGTESDSTGAIVP